AQHIRSKEQPMRRIVFLSSMLTLVVTMSLVGLSLRADARQAASATAEAGFGGTWRVTVTEATGRVFPVLSSYLADGTTFHSSPPSQPAAPGSPFAVVFSGTGHGLWEQTGEQTSAVTFDVLTSDEAGGATGRLTVSGTQQLGPDGDTFAGEYVITVKDPTGAAIATFPTTAEGVRMVIEPPTTPDATPDA
ncbi:MAG: hypothetical protein ACRDJH_14460, partial [Thermomicrobiales bacterium]